MNPLIHFKNALSSYRYRVLVLWQMINGGGYRRCGRGYACRAVLEGELYKFRR